MNRNILHWSYRDFRQFPEEVIEYSDNVEEIYLKENFIPTLPLWLFEFAHLKFLQLSGNVLCSIPEEISCLENIEYLDVSRNHLKELPKSIVRLKKLQYLNVSDNEITTIDKSVIFTAFYVPSIMSCFICRYWINAFVGNIEFQQ